MRCPSCEKETTEEQRYCSYCGQFAPCAAWFLNNASFKKWTPTEKIIYRVPRTEKHISDSMRETTSSSEKKQERISVRPGNINRFSYAKNFPILYTSKRIKGSGKTKDDPYAVTVSVNEAKNGTTKTISIIDSATGDRIPAELEIPAGVQNGRLLKMESSNRKQTLYVAVYIENIPEKVFLGYLLGCLGFSIATTAWSFVLVSKKAFWIFIIIILIVLAVIIRKKAKRS